MPTLFSCTVRENWGFFSPSKLPGWAQAFDVTGCITRMRRWKFRVIMGEDTSSLLESWESVKGESSSLRVANARMFFFLFFFPSDLFFLSFSFPDEANTCFPFIIIYYFARYSSIACIMWLKTHACQEPAFISLLGQKMLSRFFFKQFK